MSINNQHLPLNPSEHYLNIIANAHLRFLDENKKHPERDIFTCVIIAAEASAYFRNHCDEKAAGPVILFSERISSYWDKTFRPIRDPHTSAWLRGPEGAVFDAPTRNEIRGRMFLAVLNESDLEINNLRTEIKRNFTRYNKD